MGSPLRVVRGHGDARGGRRELSEEPSRRALTASRCVRLGVCETGAARDQQVWAHGDPPRTVNTNVAHYAMLALREAGGSAISVIKTLRLLVADLAHKTAQNCTKMPARRCPRMLALLLAAAALAAARRLEDAHEWAGLFHLSRTGRTLEPDPTPGGRRRCVPGVPRLAAAARRGPRVARPVASHQPPRARARRRRSPPSPRRKPRTSGRASSSCRRATSTRGSRRRRAVSTWMTRWSSSTRS